MSTAQQQGFWGIVELLGHRRVAGWVTEVLFGGTRLVRVAPDPEVTEVGDPRAPMFGGGAIYCLSPCTEAAARRAREDVSESIADYYQRITSAPALPPYEEVMGEQYEPEDEADEGEPAGDELDELAEDIDNG